MLLIYGSLKAAESKIPLCRNVFLPNTMSQCSVVIVMSAAGGKADIIRAKADIAECPLVTLASIDTLNTRP